MNHASLIAGVAPASKTKSRMQHAVRKGDLLARDIYHEKSSFSGSMRAVFSPFLTIAIHSPTSHQLPAPLQQLQC
jgi:hypothetical protein